MREYVEDFIEAARREVDALTPGSEPIAAPLPPPPPRRRSEREKLIEALRLSGFVPSPTDLLWRHPDGRVVDEDVLRLNHLRP